MDADKIRGFHSAEPFYPFTLIMTNGDTFFVDRRHHLAISPTGRHLTFALPNGGFHGFSIDCVADVVAGMAQHRREAS